MLTTSSLAFALVLLAGVAVPGSAMESAIASQDLIAVDSQARAVFRIDPETGAQSVITSGGRLKRPVSVAFDAAGDILVVDGDRFGTFGSQVIRVDPVTGTQTVVTSEGSLLDAHDIAIDADGTLLIADFTAPRGLGGIVAVDPVTGAQSVLYESTSTATTPFDLAIESSGDIVYSRYPKLIRLDRATLTPDTLALDVGRDGVAIEARGAILVEGGGASGLATVVRVDPTTGATTTVSSGGKFGFISDIAVGVDSVIYVSDETSIFCVDPTTGRQQLVSSNGGFDQLSGVAIRGNPSSVNRPPVAVDDGPYLVDEGGTFGGSLGAVEALLANDTDPDCDALTAIKMSDPTHGNLALNGDGTFTYVHDGSETTNDSFTYKVNDGEFDSDVATVSIDVTPVNDPPVAVDDGPFSVDEGGILDVNGVLDNDTDIEGDPLTAVKVTDPAHGTLALSPDGSFSYSHDGSESIADSFTYVANDGELESNEATVTIEITPVNDPPVAVDDGPYVVDEGDVLFVDAPGVHANDSDAEGDPPASGWYTFADHGDVEMFLDGSFVYVHDGSETTTDSFTYWWSDGSADSNEATVTIEITPVNDPPVAVDDGPYIVDEGDVVVVAAPGLLANDSDPDGDPVAAASYTDPAHGTLTVFTDGSFTYTHDGSNTTSDSFSYWATDGTLLSNEATVSITINPVIDLELTKEVAAGQVTVGDETSFTISVTNQGPSDATGVAVTDSLRAALTYVSDNGGGSFDPATGVWTVGNLAAGTTANLELVVAVNQAGTFANVAQVTTADQSDVDSTPNNDVPAEDDLDAADVTAVEPPNQPPIAVDDGPYTVAQGGTLTVNGVVNGVLGNDNDPDGDPLAAVTPSDPAHGTVTLDRDGSFVYVHDGTATTTDSFTYRANDGKDDSNIATVTIRITPVQVLPGTLEATSVGLVDPSQGRWYLLDHDTRQVNSFFYGNPGDVPFLGDWDCDGVATPGLFRQSDAYAYLRNSNTVGIADVRFYFGNPSDVPLAGDFDGDGCDSLSIYRPAEQRFYIINKLGENEGGLGGAEYAFTLGDPGDKPVVGDWDGDGIDEVGLHRESTGFFYYRNTLDVGIADGQFYFGDPGDRLVAGDWGIIDGVETPACFRPSDTTFFVRWTNTPGVADDQFVWGDPDWLPVSGIID